MSLGIPCKDSAGASSLRLVRELNEGRIEGQRTGLTPYFMPNN